MSSIASFGQWVRTRRTALRLTQAELARQVYCSEITIRKIEGDERRPSPEIARGLAEHLQLPGDLVPRFLKVARGELATDHLPLLQNDHERPRHWLPVLSRADLAMPATSFLGRTQEVADICDLLQRPALRLLTLVGPPGIGKSRLSLHVAAELGNAFLDGAQFVPLAPLHDPILVPDAIAQLFGFAESGFATPLDYLRFELRQRHLLLVLDNFEQVLPASQVVQEILAAAPQIKVLVTSRVPLGLPDEHVYTAPPLSPPAATHAPSALAAIRSPAVQLLVSRARTANPAFALTSANAGAIAALCARVDGLPLAIELVAAHLKTLAPERLLADLTAWLATPHAGAGDLPERHRTLRHAIAWSYDLLPPATQALFARLGVFVHGATAELVEALCTALGDGDVALLEHVALLVNHNLVRAEVAATGVTRYTMLETLLDFARDQAALRREWNAARQAHAQVFCAFIEAVAAKIHGLERRAWMERIEQENDNLRAALHWAKESGDCATLTRLVAALSWFWEMNGRRVEARTWLDAAMATPSAQQPPRARGRVLQMAAHIAGEEGRPDESRQFAQASLAVAAAIGDDWTVALAQRDLVWVLFVADNAVEGALALADTAAQTLLAMDDRRNYLLTLLDAAMICQLTGDAARGMPYARTARRLAQEWNDEPSECEAVSALGLLASVAGDYASALPLLEECLAMSARLPNGKLIAWSHYRMGQVLLDAGDVTQAAEHFAESARLWADRNEVLAIAYCQSGIANCHFRQGQLEQAHALYQSTLETYRRCTVQHAEAWTLWNLAHTAAATGNGDGVAPLLQASLAFFRARSDGEGIAGCVAALRDEWSPARQPIRP